MNDDTLEKELRDYTHEVASEAARRAFEHKDKELEEIRTRIYERRLRSVKRMEMLGICLGSSIVAIVLSTITFLNMIEPFAGFLPDPVKWMIFGNIMALLSLCWVIEAIHHFVSKEEQDNE